MKEKTKEETPVATTPLGVFSFPHFAEPDTGRPNSSGKRGGRLLVKKSDLKTPAGRALMQTILDQGRKLVGDDQAVIGDFKVPVYDIDKLPKTKRDKYPEAFRTGYVEFRATAHAAFPVYDHKMAPMTLDAVKNIEGGDVGRMVLAVGTYSNNGGGVGLWINAVQYKEKGSIKFGSRTDPTDHLDVLDVEIADVDEVVDAADAEPAPAVAKPKKEKPSKKDEDDFFDFS